MITLYWAPRTRAFRAVWALEEAGLPYEIVPVDLASGEQEGEAFRAINPMMKVPALVDGAARVTESGAICAYIAERAEPGRLAPLPGDPQRGEYLRWLFFSPGCVEGALIEKFGGVQLPSRAAGWGSFDRVFTVLDAALSSGASSGPWLLGERFTAADVMIGADLNFCQSFGALPPHPHLAAYLARCQARPAFQQAKARETPAP